MNIEISQSMQYIKQASYFILGAAVVTGIFYAGITAWSALFLDPKGSYFDQEPGFADAIMFAWLVCMVIGGLVGERLGWLGRLKQAPSPPDVLPEAQQIIDTPEVFVFSKSEDESCKEFGNTSACHPNPSVRIDFCDVDGCKVGYVSYVRGVTRNCVYIFQIETNPKVQRRHWGAAMLRYVWNSENNAPIVPVDKRYGEGAAGFWRAAEQGRLGIPVAKGVTSQMFGDETKNP